MRVVRELCVHLILYCIRHARCGETKKARLVQDGEFIDVFLLPYDGLYDALVVSTLVIYPGEISVWTALRLSLDILLLPTRQYLCWGSGNSHLLAMHDHAVSVLQAKQQETGWDIDARLLLYADAIKRTEILTKKSTSAGHHSLSPGHQANKQRPGCRRQPELSGWNAKGLVHQDQVQP